MAPSRKLTVPVGVVMVDETVAVKRIGLVRTAVLALLVRETVAMALPTTTVVEPLLVLYCPSLPE